jgi:hypothetical protein
VKITGEVKHKVRKLKRWSKETMEVIFKTYFHSVSEHLCNLKKFYLHKDFPHSFAVNFFLYCVCFQLIDIMGAF